MLGKLLELPVKETPKHKKSDLRTLNAQRQKSESSNPLALTYGLRLQLEKPHGKKFVRSKPSTISLFMCEPTAENIMREGRLISRKVRTEKRNARYLNSLIRLVKGAAGVLN